jgi:hypothetical protein
MYGTAGILPTGLLAADATVVELILTFLKIVLSGPRNNERAPLTDGDGPIMISVHCADCSLICPKTLWLV